MKKLPPQYTVQRITPSVRAAWFHEECYDKPIHLLWCVGKPFTPESYSAALHQVHGIVYPHDGDLPLAQCFENLQGEHRAIIITLAEPWKPNARMISTLAHEAFHATEIITLRRGVVGVPNQCSEAHAYLLDSIVRRCLNLLGVK